MPSWSVIAYSASRLRGQGDLERRHASREWLAKTGQSIGMSEVELEPFADAFEHGERAAAKMLI